MTRMTRFAAAALAGSVVFATPAFAESAVVGTWDITANTQMGDMKSTMTVAETDGAYIVAIEDAPMGGGGGGGPEMQMDSSISDIAVDGSTLKFTRSLKNPQFSIDLKYDLTVEGDALTGKAGSDFGDSAITGTRAE